MITNSKVHFLFSSEWFSISRWLNVIHFDWPCRECVFICLFLMLDNKNIIKFKLLISKSERCARSVIKLVGAIYYKFNEIFIVE